MFIFCYDCLDRPFHIGDYFTMPLRRYSSMWVQVGKVLGFKETKNLKGEFELRPIVRCAEKHWKFGWQANSKNATLERADRATIVSTSSIPPKLIEVLSVIPEIPVAPQITQSEATCTT